MDEFETMVYMSIPLKVDIRTGQHSTMIHYKDGALEAVGVGSSYHEAAKDFKIDFARRIHDLANPIDLSPSNLGYIN